MASSRLLLMPLLLAVLADSCTLPDASTEIFNITTEFKKWYQQYRYPSVYQDALGCFNFTQSSGEAPNEMSISGRFSKNPEPATADVTIEGNRLHVTYFCVYHNMFNGDRNIVYASPDIFIEHFCTGNTDEEMAYIFTAEKNPSEELINQIWKEVDARPEIDRSKFQKATC